MELIYDAFKGMVVISFLSLAGHSCSVKEMANEAVKAHRKGLSPYGEYSRLLTKK